MEYNASKVREFVQEYMTGRISREELGAWALSAYEDLLKGGYRALEKLAVYPFLKTLSSLHVEVDELADQYPATREDMERICEILCGGRTAGFCVEIALSNRLFPIPPEQYARINELYEAMEDGERSASGRRIVKSVHDTLSRREPDTIYDLVEGTIAELADAAFGIQDGSLQRREPYRLYSPASQESVLFKRLTQGLETFHRNNNFCFLISFNQGMPKVSLII